MNLDANPTLEQLRELLGRGDDYAGHHVLWVSKNGDVRLSRVTETESAAFEASHPDVQMRYETFLIGHEYVGLEAAADDWWLTHLFENLLSEWTRTKGKPEGPHIKLDNVVKDA
jgi:hypothetical protein